MDKKFIAHWAIYFVAMILMITSSLLPKSAKPEANILNITSSVLMLIFVVLLIKRLWDDHKRFKKEMADLDQQYQRMLDSYLQAKEEYNNNRGGQANPAQEKQAVDDLNKRLKKG